MAPTRSPAAAAAAAAAIARATGLAHASSSAVPSAAAAAAAFASRSREHVVRLLTFNVWFEPLAMAARMKAIGGLVERLRPAVIGFQEVTRESLAMLRKQRWSQFYDCSIDTAPPFSEAYFVVLFSALPVLSLETLPFANTGMGRELLAFEVQVAPGKTLLVGSSHLESLPQFKRERVSQLKQSLQFLSERVDAGHDKCLGAVLMGDTNLLRGDMKLLDPLCAAEELTVEEAKTSRSKCRQCGELIEKGVVRVGKAAKDRLPNGKVVEITMWYHKDCFLDHKGIPENEKEVVRRSAAVGKTDDGAVAKQAVGGDPQDAMHAASLGLPPKWKDLWLSVDGNTDENGYTYDGRKNTMIQNRSYQSRLDRVYFYPGKQVKSHTEAFEKIEMVGTEPIADGVWPSDHFGLLTTFCFDSAVSRRADAKRKRDENGDEEKAPLRGSKQEPIELD